MLSLEDGAPDFATIDNAEMIAGVKDEYEGHASAFADATNVFDPHYRQSGLMLDEHAKALLSQEIEENRLLCINT